VAGHDPPEVTAGVAALGAGAVPCPIPAPELGGLPTLVLAPALVGPEALATVGAVVRPGMTWATTAAAAPVATIAPRPAPMVSRRRSDSPRLRCTGADGSSGSIG
jgi:hypothetical protein